MLAFTGKYKGKTVSVMGHGMGIPSIGIYSYELFKFYETETILRVGSAGAYDEKIKVGDVIIADEAFSFSTYADELGVEVKEKVLYAAPSLVSLAEKTSAGLGIHAIKARVFSSDVFYGKASYKENAKRTGALAVEMEAFALYANAIKLNKKALTLLTASDSFVTGEALSAQDRQTSFKSMISLGLEMAHSLL
jgi:purine-nucleoside phosphorylase